MNKHHGRDEQLDELTHEQGADRGTDGGHHDLVAQPHDSSEGPVADAELVAARISTDAAPMGTPGEPLNRRSPFWIGMAATAGVAVTVGVVAAIVTVSSVLVLIGLALFIAVGLEPAVSWLARHRLPRWAAVSVVILATVALIGGFLALAIPVLVEQATQFVNQVPTYLRALQDRNSFLGGLNNQFHIQQSIEDALGQGSGSVTSLAGGVLGAGLAVFSAITSGLVVIVLTIYLLADLPRIRAGLYRLAPASRRPRVILIGDEIFAKVGGYVLGNLLISIIAGGATTIWLLSFGVPYAVLLGLFVALLDLIPVIGSAIAGIVVTLIALTVSLPVGIATAGFFIAYRLVEDYLLTPKIIGGVVKVPALVTVVAVLLGAALLGVIGALVAIPLAAAAMLIIREVMVPRLDQS
ncbi:AI-2E family transporter [Pseudonocardia sp. GCM10023141]|uniref:AI-2E family transporter n=1 Tax=Pseudonocardia sp. GCM10023141 TaxID=3252653 RepID=UPI00361E9A9D